MSYKTGWGFKPPVRQHSSDGDDDGRGADKENAAPRHQQYPPPRVPAAAAASDSSVPPPLRLPRFHATLQEDEDEEDEEDMRMDDGRSQAKRGGHPAASSSSSSALARRQGQGQGRVPPPSVAPRAAAAAVAAPRGTADFTIDLNTQFGGETRALWPFRTLNHVQSSCFMVCHKTDHNVVVAAPTGVGKTFLFDLAIVRLLQETESLAPADGAGRRPWKIVYIAPAKALCQQRLLDWQARFGKHFGVRCVEVTGDSSGLRDVATANIILTTPEKFDAVSRDWRDNLFLLGSIRLLLIDEAHSLGDDPRGATLEALVCRMKLIKGHRQVVNRGLPAAKMRIIAASATLPNAEDLGTWLGCPPEYVFNFDYTYRPVPLDVHVLGYAPASNPFLFARTLEDKVLDVIVRYSDRKPTLVFCESKKACESLASKLAAAASAIGPRHQQHQQQPHTTDHAGIANPRLKELLQGGGQVAFHHAGIAATDRALVERLFQEGHVRVLCSTSTLAVGINTPAHLVVIKGTMMWRGAGKGYEDMAISSVLQMIGRAGRPGFDDRGVAVIMTSKDQQHRYESMSKGQELVESMLPKRIHEALNAEICSRVIASFDEALAWIQSTYLWVRMHKNPRHYRDCIPAASGGDGSVEGRLRATLLRVLQELDDEQVVRFSDLDLSIQPLVAGKVMSKTLISFDTMKVLRALPADASLEALLWACSQCAEVASPVRKADKRPLNELLAKARFKTKFKRCQLPSHKAFVLAQAVLAGQEVADFTLRLEAEAVMDNMARIARAHKDYAVETGKGAGAYVSLLLGRSLRARMWEVERDAVLRQVEGIGPAIGAKLAAAGVKTFQDVLDTPPATLEALANRRHPFGHELQHRVAAVLGGALAMRVRQTAATRDTATLVVELYRDAEAQAAAMASGSGGAGEGTGAFTGGRGPRRLHFTLCAFASDAARQLLLFRDVPFGGGGGGGPSMAVAAASSRTKGDGGEEEEADEAADAGPPALHRIEFKVSRPIVKQEVDDGSVLGGADKRFRITLALVAPYISLDCLQIFYPHFEGAAADEGSSGGGSPGWGVASQASEPPKPRREPRKRKVVKPKADEGAPGTLPSLFKKQEVRARERREQELEEHEQERERERDLGEMGSHGEDELPPAAAAATAAAGAAGRSSPARPPSRAPAAPAAAAATAAATAEVAQSTRPYQPQQPQQQQPQPRPAAAAPSSRATWRRTSGPAAPAVHAAAVDTTPAEPFSSQAAATRGGRAVSGSSGNSRGRSDVFDQYRFAPGQTSPILDLTVEAEPEASMEVLGSLSAGSSSSSASYRSATTTAAAAAAPTSSFSSASASTSSTSAMTSGRRRGVGGGPASMTEMAMLQGKAREAQMDQVPISRINKPKASPSPLNPRSGVGPLLAKRVVGSSSRAAAAPATSAQQHHQQQQHPQYQYHEQDEHQPLPLPHQQHQHQHQQRRQTAPAFSWSTPPPPQQPSASAPTEFQSHQQSHQAPAAFRARDPFDGGDGSTSLLAAAATGRFTPPPAPSSAAYLPQPAPQAHAHAYYGPDALTDPGAYGASYAQPPSQHYQQRQQAVAPPRPAPFRISMPTASQQQQHQHQQRPAAPYHPQQQPQVSSYGGMPKRPRLEGDSSHFQQQQQPPPPPQQQQQKQQYMPAGARTAPLPYHQQQQQPRRSTMPSQFHQPQLHSSADDDASSGATTMATAYAAGATAGDGGEDAEPLSFEGAGFF